MTKPTPLRMAKRTRGGGAAALDKYEVGAMLGSGSYAVVKRVTRKSDLEDFAMKLIDMEESDAGEVEHERQILKLLGLHRHIVCLVDSFVLPGSTAFVMELADGGEVFDKICNDGPYSEAKAADVIRQIALGVAFIHTAGVVHRDLKPENLLLTSTGVVKLADFGLAERCGRGAKPLRDVAGTAAFMAPEMLLADEPGGAPYTSQVDVFSLGGIVFSLLGGYPAFDPDSAGDWDATIARVERGQWSFTAHFPARWRAVSAGAKAFIRALLEPSPSKRLTADQVLLNPWVRGDGVAASPLPHSDVQLKHFNEGRRVWRQAAAAAAVFAASPLATGHFSGSSGGSQAGATGAAGAASGRGEGRKRPKGSAEGGAASGGAGSGGHPSTASLPQAVVCELRATFGNFDIDGDGRIDAREMRHAVCALGAPPCEAQRLIERYDVDGDVRVRRSSNTGLAAALASDAVTDGVVPRTLLALTSLPFERLVHMDRALSPLTNLSRSCAHCTRARQRRSGPRSISLTWTARAASTAPS